MPWNYATDPFYRALLADIADTEWQMVEAEFLRAMRDGARMLAEPAWDEMTSTLGGFHMADDKSKTGEPDRSRISTGEDYEVRDWAKSIGVSEDEIRRAVKEVGNSADAVRKFLGK